MNGNKNTGTPMSWVTTWGTAEENFNATPEGMPRPLADTTVRQIVRVTTSGDKMKLRLSNRYGKSDVVIRSMHVAKQIKADQSAIDLSTDTMVKAMGSEQIVIPAGEVIETDPLDFSVTALDNIAVTMYFGSAPTTTDEMTGHRGARATTYQVAGNEVSAAAFLSPATTTSWYFLADVSLMSPAGSKAVVCFGDSIMNVSHLVSTNKIPNSPPPKITPQKSQNGSSAVCQCNGIFVAGRSPYPT